MDIPNPAKAFNSVECIEKLVSKNGAIFESKRQSLKNEMDRILLDIVKDRELLHRQEQEAHDICKKRLAATEKELQDTQGFLRETQNEAACLLESNHMELERLQKQCDCKNMEMKRMQKEWDCKQMEIENMQKEWDCKNMEIERMQNEWNCKQMEVERMQKERDDARMKVEAMQEESCRLQSYGNRIKDHVHKLVAKLREYPQETIKTQDRIEDEWNQFRRSVTLLETSLEEFQDKNQFLVDQDQCIKELQEITQIAIQTVEKSNAGCVDAKEKLNQANILIGELNCKVKCLQCELHSTEEKASALKSQLNEANLTISDLHNQIDWLQGQFEALQEKHVASLKEKLELDTAAQMREAAISVLRLRLYALQCELKKERFLRITKTTDSDTQSLTPVSCDGESKPSGRCAPVQEMEDGVKATTWNGRYKESPEQPVMELEEESVHESHQDSMFESRQNTIESQPESVNDCATETTLAESATSFETESHRSIESWNHLKMKKLEQALTEAHRRYMLLSKERTSSDSDSISMTNNAMEGSQSAALQEAGDLNLQLRPPLMEFQLQHSRSQIIDNRDTCDISMPVPRSQCIDNRDTFDISMPVPRSQSIDNRDMCDITMPVPRPQCIDNRDMCDITIPVPRSQCIDNRDMCNRDMCDMTMHVARSQCIDNRDMCDMTMHVARSQCIDNRDMCDMTMPVARSQCIDNRDMCDITMPVVNKFPKKVRFKEDSLVEMEDMHDLCEFPWMNNDPEIN